VDCGTTSILDVTGDRLQDFAGAGANRKRVMSAGGVSVSGSLNVIFDEKTFACNGR
jgi:hypothetical protein